MSLKKFGKRVKKNKMDKFYTRPEVSKVLVQNCIRLRTLMLFWSQAREADLF